GGVLPRAQRREQDRSVQLPRRGGEDEVELLLVAHATVVLRSARVTHRLRAAGVGDALLRPLDLRRYEVADRPDLDPFDAEEVRDVVRALVAYADEPDAHHLQRRRRKERRVGRGK